MQKLLQKRICYQSTNGPSDRHVGSWVMKSCKEQVWSRQRSDASVTLVTPSCVLCHKPCLLWVSWVETDCTITNAKQKAIPNDFEAIFSNCFYNQLRKKGNFLGTFVNIGAFVYQESMLQSQSELNIENYHLEKPYRSIAQQFWLIASAVFVPFANNCKSA